jgi:hypothetical protein
MARFCLATGLSPSEYYKLDLYDLEAFSIAFAERN